MKYVHPGVPLCLFLFSCLCGLTPNTACAQEPVDTRRLLEQSTRQQEATREDQLLESVIESDRPTIMIDGEHHLVGHNANDVGRALYLFLKQRQWHLVAHFLAEYLTYSDRDPKLVHYAQGVLARVRGKYREAAHEFRALLDMQPDFIPARLELARTLFEDQQNREADALLAAIAANLDSADPSTHDVHTMILSYRAALARRREWNGVFALGTAWSDNVNRTSASQTCLLMLPTGQCLIDRKLPDAIVSAGYEFEGSVSKTIPFSGHHGLTLQALGFGQGWRDNSLYNELTALVRVGYQYRSGRTTLNLAPSFDYSALGNAALSAAPGLHGQWSRLYSPRSMLQVEADWKAVNYRRQGYAQHYDGIQRSGSVTYLRTLGAAVSAFGGWDISDNTAPQAVNAWRSHGVRAGAQLHWPHGFAHTVSVTSRQREYGAYSALLGARRKDHELGATLIVRASRWALGAFVPVLTLRHYRVGSNVDWLYRYRRNTVSVKLQKSF